MKSIRISEQTYDRLVALKHGMATFSDVIDYLLSYREQYLEKKQREAHARSAMEADRTKDR